MKHLFDILLLMLLAMLLCGSCASKKHFINSTEFTSNTDKNSIASVTAQSEISSEKIRIRDTAITIARKFVSGTVQLSDLKPLYTADGVAVPQSFEVKNNGLSSKITVHPDNSIEHSAESDSMKIVIQNLVERLEQVERNNYKRYDSSAISSTVKVMTYKEFFKKSGGFLFSNWQWVLAFLILIFLDSIIKYIKNFIPFFKK